jgi:S-DNA-T family DNA segregation ATPase FtsK/SpoIIIE
VKGIIVDKNRSFRIGADRAKAAWRGTAEGTTNALDALTPLCVPFAARWDAEAKRRLELRTQEHLKELLTAQREHNSARSTLAQARAQREAARRTDKNPLSASRRAGRTAHTAARGHHREARAALRAARRQYPTTLRVRAVQAHALHAVPGALSSWWLTAASHQLTVWPTATSAALVALNAGALWLGRRTVTAHVPEDGLSAEERQLMGRLDPSYWAPHAHERGLSGTITTPPQITPAGIVCGVRLDGTWTVSDLKSKSDNVRALVGMRTETRMEVTRGARGDWARLIVRTRSASDGVSMIWTPDHVGIGVDEVTGEFVDLPLKPGTHILLAGITGMGKSVSWRPLVMRAHLDDEWTAIVVDPKRQEAIGWQHCLRCVGQEPNREERMADIYAVAQELTREMHRRQGIATGPVWVPDGKPENRKLLVVIDEGAAIVRMAKQKQYADVMDLFEELWSEARSVGFQFVWATQFPTKAVGVPAAVKENMSARLSLTVGAGEAERAIFGENAQQQGWTPSGLDGIPGRAMLQYAKRGPAPLRMWFVPDDAIAALPKADPWRSPAVQAPAAAGERPALTLVKDSVYAVPADAIPAQAGPGPETNRARVLAAVVGGARTGRDITDRTGLNKGTVSREVKALIASGDLVKGADGMLAAGEVSA